MMFLILFKPHLSGASIAQADSFIDISDAKAVGTHFTFPAGKPVNPVGVHVRPVIPDYDIQAFSFHPDMQTDPRIFPCKICTVDDGIFNERLNDQLRNFDLIRGNLNIIGKPNALFIAAFLNPAPAVNIFQFFFQMHDRIRFFKL